MSSKQQSPNKTKKPERQPQVEARQPAQADMTAALAELDGGQLQRLPDHATTRPLRQTAVLQMQRRHGNTHVQQMLRQSQTPARNGHKGKSRQGSQETGADGVEVAHEPLSDNAGAGPPTGLPVAPPPPGSNGNGTGASNGRTGTPTLVQRQEEEGDSEPTEAEKAAALAAAKAAEQQAGQTASEGQQQVAQSKTKKAAEQEAAKTAKQKASQAKSEMPPKKSGAGNGKKEKGAAKEKKARPGKAAADGAGPAAAAAAVAGAQASVPQAGRDGKAPASPEEDPGFQAAVGNIKGVAAKEKTHAPATAKAGAAQDGAEAPASEVEAKAQANQVGEMEQAPTPGFNAAAFKAKLMQRIQALAPKTAAEADNFKESGKLDGVKGEMQGQVTAEKEASQAPMQEAAQKAPDTGSVEPKPVTPLDPAAPGVPPRKVGASQAVPKSKGRGEVEAPMQAESKKPDQIMAENDITEAQLANSNEPEFQAALDSKKEARAHAKEAPQNYRQFEQTQLAQAETDTTTTAETRTQAMHGDRAHLLQQVAAQQGQTKTEDEQARRKVASDMQKIYDRTQTKVEKILDDLDADVEKVFDEGAVAAKQAFEDYVDAKMEAYKERRYGGWLGWARWIDDKVSGMPSEVNAFYQQGRQLYLKKMDAVIDNVVSIIGRGLTEAKAEIANGKKEIQQYLNKLPQDLQQVGQQAAQNIQSKFDALEEKVDSKQNELINSLANKYQENLQAVDARIEEMKQANKGLVAKAMDKIGGVIKTILKLKDMLMGVLAQAAGAIKKIIKDPIGFLGNLLGGVKQGLQGFVSNIGTHLQKGLMTWLFGAVAKAGLQMPSSFDLKGILMLVLQVLGFTWENLRAQAVKMFGEKLVNALERGFEIFTIIKEEGLGGLWQFVQEQLSNLKEMVLDGIKEMVITEVIEAGIQWLIGVLGGPAGAFVKACKAIYDIVMWFVNNGSQLMSLVQAIIGGIAAIASGNVGKMASAIENALGRAIPVVIGFLASLLGLGDISQKIKGIIQKVQAPINKAIDWVLAKAKGAAKKLGKMLGLGKGKETEGGSPDQNAKARKMARERVSKATRQPFKDEKELRGTVKQIETELIPEGLKSLQVTPKKEQPGQYDIVARSTTDVGDAQVGEEEVDTSPITVKAKTAPKEAAAKPASAVSLESLDPNIRNTLKDFWQQQIVLRPDKKKTYERYIKNIESGKRPTPTQAEMEMAFLRGSYAELGESRREVPFKSGREVKGRPKGHTRPDVLDPLGSSVEVKRYLIKNKSSLISKLKKQINDRYEGLPYDRRKKQGVIVDLRGQGEVSNDQIISLKQDIADATQLPVENIDIVIW